MPWEAQLSLLLPFFATHPHFATLGRRTLRRTDRDCLYRGVGERRRRRRQGCRQVLVLASDRIPDHSHNYIRCSTIRLSRLFYIQRLDNTRVPKRTFWGTWLFPLHARLDLQKHTFHSLPQNFAVTPQSQASLRRYLLSSLLASTQKQAGWPFECPC